MDVFMLWTTASIPVAILSGVAMAVIIRQFHVVTSPLNAGVLVGFVGVCWFLPLIAARFAVGETEWAHTGMGQLILFLIFAASTGAALAVLRRWR